MKTQTQLRVPYGFSVHGEEEIAAVVEVLKGNTALGERTKEFEAKVAKLFGKKYGIMVNSGSSANLLAFEILNLPRGSEVITPLLTFATTVAPIIQKGLVPVFCDVNPETLQIDLDQLEKVITKKTRALMIPSLMGNIPDLPRLQKIAKKHKLYFIEDSCDTLGGKINGKPSGVFSDISITSFYGSHIINGAGGGGMICVNNEKWAQRLTVLRGWGRRSSLFGEKAGSEQLKNRFRSKLGGVPYDEKFVFSEIGYNFLPLEISSAFALEQLKKFPVFKAAREKNWASLEKYFLQQNKYFSIAKKTPNVESVWLAFPIFIKKDAPFNRFELVKFLEEHNIQTRPVFTGNILKQPGFKKFPHRAPFKNYPNTEYIMKNALVVGSHHGLNENQLVYLKEVITKFVSKYERS
jgi:CDP-6-deoxy-D-xylo-4-hexulose-3-dehydrase